MSFIDKNNSFSYVVSSKKDINILVHEAQSKRMIDFNSIVKNPIDNVERSIFNVILQHCDNDTIPYVAGGWVRDHILGRNSKDIDIAVYSSHDTLNAGIRLAQNINNNSGKNIKTINDKGTAQIVINGIQVEFCPFRSEVYTANSSKPIVKDGNLKTEVLRRDFTINSLLYNIKTGEIIDYTGNGIEDLRQGIIRTTNDPNVTFSEDPNRIMRAFRFMATLGFNLDETTKEYITKFSHTLNPSGRTKELKKNTSGEENFNQLYKMFAVNNSEGLVNALYTMAETGSLYQLLGLDLNDYYEYNTSQMNRHHFNDSIFDYIMKVFKSVDKSLPSDFNDKFVIRMSALLHDFGKFSKNIRTEIDPIKLERMKKKNPNEESLKWHRFNYRNHAMESTNIASVSLDKNIRVPSDLKNRIMRLVKYHDILMTGDGTNNYSDKIEKGTLSKYDVYQIVNLITHNGKYKEDLSLFINLINSDRSAHLDNRDIDIKSFEQLVSNVGNALWTKPSDIIDGEYVLSILDPKVDKANVSLILKKIMSEYINGTLPDDISQRIIEIAVEMKIARPDLMPQQPVINGQWIRDNINPPKEQLKNFKAMIEFGNELFNKGLEENQIIEIIKNKFNII